MFVARLLMLAVVSLVLSSASFGQEKPALPPELKALEHYVGTWKSQMKVPATQEHPQGLVVHGTVESEWVVDKRWVRQTVDYDPAGGHPGMEVVTMITYDPKQKKYLLYTFAADGTVSQATGSWNEERKTMTSTLATGPNSPVVTVLADFSKRGQETWTIIFRNAEGDKVGGLSGVNVKQ